jgi:hypothetical protein
MKPPMVCCGEEPDELDEPELSVVPVELAVPAELVSLELTGVTELAPVPVMLEGEGVVPAVLSEPVLVGSVVDPVVPVPVIAPVPLPVVSVADPVVPLPVVSVADPVVPPLLDPPADATAEPTARSCT